MNYMIKLFAPAEEATLPDNMPAARYEAIRAAMKEVFSRHAEFASVAHYRGLHFHVFDPKTRETHFTLYPNTPEPQLEIVRHTLLEMYTALGFTVSAREVENIKLLHSKHSDLIRAAVLLTIVQDAAPPGPYADSARKTVAHWINQPNGVQKLQAA